MTVPWPAPAPALLPGHLPALDGLRGIAILAVMLHHFKTYGSGSGEALWGQVYATAADFGWAGVDLFFVLSGFLITGILYDTRRSSRYFSVFYARRTLRIFPLYYACLAVVFLVGPFVLRRLGQEEFIGVVIRPESQAAAWCYVLNWLVGLRGFEAVSPLIHPYWSLSIEEQFYLVWPLLVRYVGRRPLVGICGALIVTAPAARVGLHLAGLDLAAYVFTVCRTDSLAVGAVLALAARDARAWGVARRVSPYAAGLALVGLVALVAVTGTTLFGGFWMDTIGISLLALLFGGCLVLSMASSPGSPPYQLTNSRVLAFFGKYSYALYCFNQPLTMGLARAGLNGERFTRLLHSQLLGVLAFDALALAVSVAFAFASWHLFEKHFLRLKNLPLLRPDAHG
jgi:peptidoglycan/LPS O-acetylase OafA/YrhL